MTKEKLQAIFMRMEHCLIEPREEYKRYLEIRRKNEMEKVKQTLSKNGFFAAVGQGVKSYGAAYIDVTNSGWFTIEEFMESFKTILDKKSISDREVIELRQNASEAKRAILNLPEIKEIKQFNYLINLLCNFINKYFYPLFTSKATEDVENLFHELNENEIATANAGI